MEQILNLQHISYTYHTLEGETPALSDISFSLNKGEFAENPTLAVGDRRCFLYVRKTVDDLRMHIQPGNTEILRSTQ